MQKIVEELVKLDGDPESARIYIDSLPVGVIQLDRQGRVIQYNEFEAAHSKRRREHVLGKNFFEIAPCLRVQEFHNRFTEAIQNKHLDVEFHATFDLPGHPHVKIYMFYGNQSDTVWCVIEWVSDGGRTA
jgi:photoactive yellow protein